METDAAEVVREIELDIHADVVWELVTDPDELAGWVGDEVRTARFHAPWPDASDDDTARRLGWTWAPGGIESVVELTVHELMAPGAGVRTVVRVVERVVESTGAAGAASASAAAGGRWEARLFHLDLLGALAASLVPARR